MRLNSATVARASAQHPWRIVGIWVVALLLSMAVTGLHLADGLTTDFGFTDQPIRPGRGTHEGDPRPGDHAGDRRRELGYRDRRGPHVRGLRRPAPGLVERAHPETDAVAVGSYLTTSGPVSADGRTALLPVVVQTESFAVMQDVAERMQAIIDASGMPDGFTVRTFGQGTKTRTSTAWPKRGCSGGSPSGSASRC